MKFLLAITSALFFTITADARSLVKIESDVTVDGPEITLGAMVVTDGVEERYVRRIGNISLGRSAEPGGVRKFSGEGISKQILAVAPHLFIDIPKEVSVRTAANEISGKELREKLEKAIRHRMTWPEEATTLSNWNVPKILAVPVGSDRLNVHFSPGEDFLGRVNAQLEYVDPESSKTFRVQRTASVEIDVELPVLVASKPLRRGAILTSESTQLEKRSLRGLPRQFLTDLPDVAGERLAEPLSEGRVVLRRHLVIQNLVKRGDIMLVDAQTGGLEIRIEAKALENGSFGQMIQAENPVSRRRFQVEVTGEGRAMLSLPAVGSDQ